MIVMWFGNRYDKKETNFVYDKEADKETTLRFKMWDD